MKLSTLLVLTGGFTAASALAQAQLIQNGGFETGDFSGWSFGGTAEVHSGAAGSNFVHSGSKGAALGAAELSQAFLTTPGKSYRVSFWMNSILGQDPGFVQASWSNFDIPNNLDLGTVSLIDTTFDAVPSLDDAGWTKYTYTLLALGNVASLELQFFTHPISYPNNLALDDVSVTALPSFHALPDLSLYAVQLGATSKLIPRGLPYLLSSSITPVPEPATFGLAAAASLLALAWWRRRANAGSAA